MDKLAVIVLGNRKAGKTTTWNTLFGRTVRTGIRSRRLLLSDGRTERVFLISGSPEERHRYVGKIVKGDARIVLCSLQYTERARESVEFFVDEGYSLFVQWLNPGHRDRGAYPDRLGLGDYLLHLGATISIRDGKPKPNRRVRELRDFITGWASGRAEHDDS